LDGFEVETREDGIEALEALDEADFDIVITDKSMPRLGGLGLAEEMKNNGHRHIPVIMVSGEVRSGGFLPETVQKALDAEILQLALPKPISGIVLTEEILKLTGRKSGENNGNGKQPDPEAESLGSDKDTQRLRAKLAHDVKSPLGGKGKPEILVVDDNRANLRMMTVMLEMQGFQVEARADGQQGFEAYKSNGFELVITDRSMPVLDGIGLAQKIAQSDHSDIPVIMVTSDVKKREVESRQFHDAQITRAVNEGFLQAVLAKPFDIDAVMAKVFQVRPDFIERLKLHKNGDGGGFTASSLGEQPARTNGRVRLGGKTEKTKDRLAFEEYLNTVLGNKKNMGSFIQKAASSQKPLALVFSWDALSRGALAEELIFLFELMPQLKVYVSAKKPYPVLEKELQQFDPEGLLLPYREWGEKKQFNALQGLTLQEAKKRAEVHVGRGAFGDPSAGVFVMEENEASVLFLGSKALNRFSVRERTRGGEEGLVMGLPTIGVEVMLGELFLPPQVQKTQNGIYQVFAFGIQEISRELTQKLLSRRMISQSA